MTVGIPAFFQYGSSALLVTWQEEISRDMLDRVYYVDKVLNKNPPKGLIETTPGYNSILISYDRVVSSAAEFKELIVKLRNDDIKISHEPTVHKINVDYNLEYGIDLQFLSQSLKLTIDEIISIHSSKIYDVHFIGFLPGFIYLGGLDSSLHIDRRDTPRVSVPQGAVAIGGQQTGVYPSSSPGGWHIIGRTDLQLFAPELDPPCKIKMGDQVQFIPIKRSSDD